MKECRNKHERYEKEREKGKKEEIKRVPGGGGGGCIIVSEKKLVS